MPSIREILGEDTLTQAIAMGMDDDEIKSFAKKRYDQQKLNPPTPAPQEETFMDQAKTLMLGTGEDYENPSSPLLNTPKGAVNRGNELVVNTLEGAQTLVSDANEQFGQGDNAFTNWFFKDTGLFSKAADWSEGKLDYKPTHTEESVKEAFKKGGLLDVDTIQEGFNYGVEQLGKSIPDMGAMTAQLPLYIFSRTKEMANTRATNDGRTEAESGDMAAAMPFAIGSVLLDKLGLKGMTTDVAKDIGKDVLAKGFKEGVKTVLKATTKGAAKEASTEFVQEGIIEPLGETTGTEHGAEIDAERGAWGALAGFVGGSTMSAASGTVSVTMGDRLAQKLEEQQIAEPQPVEESILDNDLLKVNDGETLPVVVEQAIEVNADGRATVPGMDAAAQQEAIDAEYGRFHNDKMAQRAGELHQDIIDVEVLSEDRGLKMLEYRAEMSAAGQSPETITKLINGKFPASPKEEAITALINNGAPVSPRFGGLLIRDAVAKSIENQVRTPDEFMEVLQNEGVSDQLAAVATESYVKQDISVMDRHIAEKIDEHVDVELDNLKVEIDDEFDAIRSDREDRADIPASEPDGAGQEPTTGRDSLDDGGEPQRDEPGTGENDTAVRGTGLDAGPIGAADGLQQEDEQMGGQQTPGRVDEPGTGDQQQPVVQPTDGSGSEPVKDEKPLPKGAVRFTKQFTDNKKSYRKEAIGYPVEIEGVKAFVAKYDDGSGWNVTDEESGASLGAGNTKKEALETVERNLKKTDPKKLASLRASFKETNGGFATLDELPEYTDDIAAAHKQDRQEEYDAEQKEREDAKAETAKKEAARAKEEEGRAHEWLNSFNAMNRGRHKKTLAKKMNYSDNGVMTRQEMIESRVDDGWEAEEIGGKHAISKGDSFLNVTKAEFEYAQFLNAPKDTPTISNENVKDIEEEKADKFLEEFKQPYKEAQEEATGENLDITESAPIRLTKGERQKINDQTKEILSKPIEEVTAEDKEVLRQYTGEGGINSGTKEALTQHYTDYATIRGIYAALDGIDLFAPKKALEPAVGSGNFVGHRPGLKWTTVDIDATNHEVSRRLYPEADHYNISYEDFKKGGYDLIISNVPFVETRGAGLAKGRSDVKALHDFYFVSSLDKVNDNGVIAFVTSKGTMDKVEGKIREEIISKADVIGAYRLPSGTFSKNTHTDVVTDVIFLQKRPEGVEANAKAAAANAAFAKSTKTTDDLYLNNYYQDNPASILGDMSVGVNKMYGGRPEYVLSGTPDYSKMSLDYHLYDQSVKDTPKISKEYAEDTEAPTDSKAFAKWAEARGVEYYSQGKPNVIYGDPVKVLDYEVIYSDIEARAKVYKELTGKLADKVKLLEEIKGNANGNRTKGVERIAQYQKQFKTHPYKDNALKKLFNGIGEREMIAEYGSFFDEKFNPAQIFETETRFSGSGRMEVTADSSFTDRLLYNEDSTGAIDFTAAEHLGEADIKAAIGEGYAVLPGGKSLQNSILYYAGNIYTKLDNVNKMLDEGHPAYVHESLKAQADKLNEIIPAPKSVNDIALKGNESWIKSAGIMPFRYEVKEKWIKDGNDGQRRYLETRSEFGPEHGNYLDNRALISRKKDEGDVSFRRRMKEAQQKIREINQEILQRIKNDETMKEQIESLYNRKFNFYVKPDYTKARYMVQDVLDELPSDLSLRSNQIDWIIKSLYEGKGINAHDVGGGKTLAGVVLARLLKKRGIAKKPLFVVPSKVIKNWEKEILRAFPDAKIVSLGNLSSKTREKQLFALGNQNADYVLISYEGLKNIKLPGDIEEQYARDLLNENMKRDDLKGRALALQEERSKLYLKALREANSNKKITLDRLGIDAVIADEARKAKNVGVSGELVKAKLGKAFTLNINDKTGAVTLDSALAYDFRFKTKYISSMNNNKNIFMLDATPTPNKPIEIFTMLKHLDDSIFDEYGISTDRDFANQFFEFGKQQDKTGKWKDGLIAIKNAFALRGILDRFVDKISMQEFKDQGVITLPEENVNKHILDASEESDQVFEDIFARLTEAKNDREKRHEVMGIFSEGVSSSVDPRAYKEMAIRDIMHATPENSKVEAIIALVTKARGKDKKAGQIIFLDKAAHEATHLDNNLHQEIKQRLVEAGEDPRSVAIISGKEITNPETGQEQKSVTPAAKQRVVDLYTEGKVKVIIGTTQSAGEGMNIQKFTKDIYHMDIPWTPAEITQRNGRGVRFGNVYDSVNTHYFFQEGTFDQLMYSIVIKKRGWNGALWDADAKSRIEVSDEESGGMPGENEIMLQLEKDPIKRRQLELGIEHERLERELEGAKDEYAFMQNQIDDAGRSINSEKRSIVTIKEGMDHPTPTKELEELWEKTKKAKTKPTRDKYAAQHEEKLTAAKEVKQRNIERRLVKIEKQQQQIGYLSEAIKDAETDYKTAEETLRDFEASKIDDKGNYIAEIDSMEEC